MDVTGHVDGLECRDRVRFISCSIALVEEVVDGGVERLGRAVEVVSEVAHVRTRAKVVQLLSAKHVQAE